MTPKGSQPVTRPAQQAFDSEGVAASVRAFKVIGAGFILDGRVDAPRVLMKNILEERKMKPGRKIIIAWR